MATNEVHLTIDFQNVEIVKQKFEDILSENKRLRQIIRDTYKILANGGKTTQEYNDSVFARIEKVVLEVK